MSDPIKLPDNRDAFLARAFAEPDGVVSAGEPMPPRTRNSDEEPVSGLVAHLKYADTIRQMSNRELVKECLEHVDDLAAYDVVVEMMNRLDPQWADEMRIAESEVDTMYDPRPKAEASGWTGRKCPACGGTGEEYK